MKLKPIEDYPKRDLTPEHTKRDRPDADDNHPDVKAAFLYVESVLDTSDSATSYMWHGWALREAFLAGMTMGSMQEREACKAACAAVGSKFIGDDPEARRGRIAAAMCLDEVGKRSNVGAKLETTAPERN